MHTPESRDKNDINRETLIEWAFIFVTTPKNPRDKNDINRFVANVTVRLKTRFLSLRLPSGERFGCLGLGVPGEGGGGVRPERFSG